MTLQIYEKLALTHALKIAPLGSQSVHSRLRQLLHDSTFVRNVVEGSTEPVAIHPLSESILEDITARTCYVEKKVTSAALPTPSPIPAYPTSVQLKHVDTPTQRPEISNPKQLPDHPRSTSQVPGVVKYPISSNKVLELPPSLRSTATNILFEGDEEGTSIASLVLDSLRKVNI